MRRPAVYSVCMLLIMCLIFSGSATAQDRDRRVQPAFPISAGEKMVIYSGVQLGNNNLMQSGTGNQKTTTSASTAGIWLNLPVGTNLKRILGDFVDQDATAGKDITIQLVRVRISDGAEVLLREFDTSSISSSSASDFKQVVSNPLSHATLQGWKYGIRFSFPGGTATDALIISVIKLIYEP